VRIIVPFLGGDLADQAARIVVGKLGEKPDRVFAVANNPGDNGHFGAEIVAKARPDGYTLLFAPLATYAAAAGLRARLHYDLLADFTPVTLIANEPQLLVVHPSLPVKSVATLIALAKARPGEIRWASHGNASPSRLELEMFSGLSGISVTPIRFRESSAALPALLVGDADLLFDSLAATLTHIKAGRLRAVAVAGSKRARALPELPTVAGAGIKGFESDHWFALLAPEGIEMPVVSRLNDDIAKAVGAGDVSERLLSLGFETHRSTPAELAAIMRTDVAKWAKVIKASEINAR
jgi:tripartite-type tricarboxylate transporter receptor subunit TctC